MFGHTEVAQLLQTHCRVQRYMGVTAATCVIFAFISCYLLISFIPQLLLEMPGLLPLPQKQMRINDGTGIVIHSV
jgi:hypothetical protein